MTSSFGVRIDPFLGRPAMHTGIDFHGTQGDSIRATASGTVTLAGWNGGYGRLVEVDHANGLATRYGHLSEIDVHDRQTIKIGQIVGRLGSTGRSTGPHLHYETRHRRRGGRSARNSCAPASGWEASSNAPATRRPPPRSAPFEAFWQAAPSLKFVEVAVGTAHGIRGGYAGAQRPDHLVGLQPTEVEDVE